MWGGTDGDEDDLSGRGGTLGRYRLIERVGRGQQADVWRALRVGDGFEEVALKVLPASASARDPRRRTQLRREAERGARLVGPALLPAIDFGEADGAAYMAMPLVVGATLAAVIAQRRAVLEGRPVVGAHRLAEAPEADYLRAVVGLMARVARAAAGAHDARVAHRDIKPDNVLVRRRYGTGSVPPSDVFLCDFGLARDLDVATAAQLRNGEGTPLYMSPERLLKLPADEVRADVYALGATLFEALTLAPPLEIPRGLRIDLWARHLASARPRRPRDLRPSIPRGVEDVVLRATARDPDRRHRTAGDLADALDAVLARRDVA